MLRHAQHKHNHFVVAGAYREYGRLDFGITLVHRVTEKGKYVLAFL